MMIIDSGSLFLATLYKWPRGYPYSLLWPHCTRLPSSYLTRQVRFQPVAQPQTVAKAVASSAHFAVSL